MKEAQARLIHILECTNCFKHVIICSHCELCFLDDEKIFCNETGKHYCEDCAKDICKKTD